jgi:hypothetical protein
MQPQLNQEHMDRIKFHAQAVELPEPLWKFIESAAEMLANYFPLKKEQIKWIFAVVCDRLSKKYPEVWSADSFSAASHLGSIWKKIPLKEEISREFNAILPDQSAIIEVGIEGYLFTSDVPPHNTNK